MLRKLEFKDIPFMLEWMHDEGINCNFQYPFNEMDAKKAEEFIKNSFKENERHFAFTNENDEYLGTISLKNISWKNNNAEYAIVTRRKAQGTGVTKDATKGILEYAFWELKLHKVYLNVLEKNKRAQHFYEKCNFLYEGAAREAVKINNKYYDLLWYGITETDFIDNMKKKL